MCYESLLGLQGCDRPEPTTGLYIDDLGINQTLLGQLITDQYNSGVELFEAKRAFAWRKMSSDILSRLNPMMKADRSRKHPRLEAHRSLKSGVSQACRVFLYPYSRYLLCIFILKRSRHALRALRACLFRQGNRHSGASSRACASMRMSLSGFMCAGC